MTADTTASFSGTWRGSGNFLEQGEEEVASYVRERTGGADQSWIEI